MLDMASAYAEIIKSERQADGTLLVYGKATDDSLDIDQQICDAGWLDRAMPDWFKTGGNIREQHSNIAAGVAKEYEQKRDGHYISALVVDPNSVKKVETGVLKGFSIGIRAPRIVRDEKAANGRIIDGQIVEVSLVDRPANPNAKLVLAKSVNGEESLMKVEEMAEDVVAKQYGETAEEETAEGPMVAIGTAEHELEETKAETTEGCDCPGCKMCKEAGGCENGMCQGHEADKEAMPDEEMKSVNKCLECGCHMPANNHGMTTMTDNMGNVTNISTATMVAPTGTPVPTPAIQPPTPKSAEPEVSSEEKSEEDTTQVDDEVVKTIIAKAVQSAKEAVQSEVTVLKSAKEAAEKEVGTLKADLAKAQSLAVGSGPKRTAIKSAEKTTNEYAVLASTYAEKAANTTDQMLAQGYRSMAKEFLEKARKEQTNSEKE